MTNHPNRTRRKDAPTVPYHVGAWLREREAGKTPKPEQIHKTRYFAGPTLAEMATLLHVSKRTYQDWEAGRVEMHPNHWLAMRCACVAFRRRVEAEIRAIRDEDMASSVCGAAEGHAATASTFQSPTQ